MSRYRKSWSGIGMLALIGFIALMSCERREEKRGKEPATEVPPEATAPPRAGDERYAVEPGGPVADDIAWLTRLGLIRGRLLAGMELWRSGKADAARTHLQNPEGASGETTGAGEAAPIPGLAVPLRRLSEVAQKGADPGAVEAAWLQVQAALTRAEAAARPETGIEPGVKLQVAANLVHEAADRYASGVVKSKVVDLPEYQDAYGLTRVAGNIVNSIDPGSNEALRNDLVKIREDLEVLESAWPDLVAPDWVEADASLIGDTAKRMEEAAKKAQ